MAIKFYELDSAGSIKEYIDVGDSFGSISRYCIGGKLQFLNHNQEIIEVEPNSGNEFPDFIYERGVPLISDKMKKFFDDYGIDNLFYKKYILKKSNIGREEIYWLALPPRIECLDYDKSEIDQELKEADSICIINNKIGRYKIFKLAGVSNLEIIITEDLAQAIREQHFEGVHIIEIK